MENTNDIPRAYAFFDVDDTLITIKSLLRFQEFWYQWTADEVGRAAYISEIQGLLAQDASWEFVNRRFYAHFAGRPVEAVKRCVSIWFEETERSLLNQQASLFQPVIVRRLHEHRQEGIEPVFVSGSFPLLLEPIAQRLGVQHVLAIRQQVVDGKFTGEILPPQTIGQGKADAVLEFLKDKSATAENCFAYGDDISDAPMLGCVGFPFVVKGGRRLEAYAEQYGWPVIDPTTDDQVSEPG
jgi:HAD superfamily hydrolase (TIGR01490 family)